MAVRVTHTNNSDGHDGTFVYRSTSPMDPQALPTPIANEPPVALGAVFEYIDTPEDNQEYCYRTQDHEGGQVSTVSDEVCVFVGDDFSTAQAGDYIGGGVYAGTLTIDSVDYHLVFALQSGELANTEDTRWKTTQTDTAGSWSLVDGLANTQNIINAGLSDHPAAEHCVNYVDGDGNDDYYLPAPNELFKGDALVAASHPEFSTDPGGTRWSSRETSDAGAQRQRWTDGATFSSLKDIQTAHVRPIRRIPA